MSRSALVIIAVLCILLAAAEYDRETTRRELAELRASLRSARTIVRAVDGDTLELDGGEKLRLLGVNTPELYAKTDRGGWAKLADPDPRAVAAYEYLRSLEGQKIRLTMDDETRDRYGRLLAHAYLLPDGPDLASHILRQGWSEVCAIPPNTRRYGDWRRAGGSDKQTTNIDARNNIAQPLPDKQTDKQTPVFGNSGNSGKKPETAANSGN